jgi:hypothetical protein
VVIICTSNRRVESCEKTGNGVRSTYALRETLSELLGDSNVRYMEWGGKYGDRTIYPIQPTVSRT